MSPLSNGTVCKDLQEPTVGVCRESFERIFLCMFQTQSYPCKPARALCHTGRSSCAPKFGCSQWLDYGYKLSRYSVDALVHVPCSAVNSRRFSSSQKFERPHSTSAPQVRIPCDGRIRHVQVISDNLSQTITQNLTHCLL